MSSRLNGWQRLWIVVAVVLLVFVGLVVAIEFPDRDQDVLRELQSSDCLAYRGLQAGDSTDVGPCFDLVAYQSTFEVKLSSVRDYEENLRGRRYKVVFYGLLWWAGLAGTIYLFGFAVAWVRRGFVSKAPQKRDK